jgi:hypothetical protein
MKKSELRQIIKEEIDKMLEDSSYEEQIKNIVNQKNLQKGDKIKWMFSFSGWRDKTPVEHTGTFSRWGLILKNGMIQSLIPKYIKSAVGIVAMVKDDKITPNQLQFLLYYFHSKFISEDDQKAFETLEKI